MGLNCPVPFFAPSDFEASYLFSSACANALPLPAQGRYLAFHGLVEFGYVSFRILRNDRLHGSNTAGPMQNQKFQKPIQNFFTQLEFFSLVRH
jgi:hypothetical protein